ncbi:hypothetical protein BD560DRAFT_418677 [Blakeslea trispora]|nr:hypothetical protein BD560DRAFT_418677 [Blakeslea trispora]
MSRDRETESFAKQALRAISFFQEKGKSSLKVVCSVFTYSINSLTLAFLERCLFPRCKARDTSFFVRSRTLNCKRFHLSNGILKDSPEYRLVSSRLLQGMIQGELDTNSLGGLKRILDGFLLNVVGMVSTTERSSSSIAISTTSARSTKSRLEKGNML